jgi:hypothetical protein
MTTLPPSLKGGSGAGNRVRTGDLNLGKVALYQLSYSRIPHDYPPPCLLEQMGLPAPSQPAEDCSQPRELLQHFPVASTARVQVAPIVCTTFAESRKYRKAPASS